MTPANSSSNAIPKIRGLGFEHRHKQQPYPKIRGETLTAGQQQGHMSLVYADTD